MRHEMREADISRKALIQKIADFLQKVLPGNAPVKSKIIKHDFTEHPSSPTHTPPLSGHHLLHYRLRNMKLYTRRQKDQKRRRM